MKVGKSLTELAAEIERQQNSKRDYLVDTRNLRMNDAGAVALVDSITPADAPPAFPTTDHAHRQIGEHVKIPAAYYDRMRTEAPDLLATNVNRWFDKNPAVRMVRTLDGGARAFLSDRYRPLDNVQLLEAALPIIGKLDLQIISCEVTATRLYVKAVDKSINRDLKAGVVLGRGHERFDTVSPAIVLSNSEIGAGALAIETSVWTGGCSNLMVIQSRSHRAYHAGKRHELSGEDTYALLSDETKAQTDHALWMQIGDIVKGAFDQAKFDAVCGELEAARNSVPMGDPLKTIELAQTEFGLTDGEKSSVLTHLIKGGDLSKYGLHAAITRAAEDLPDYDRASQFEKLGGKVIALPANDWQRFAVAA